MSLPSDCPSTDLEQAPAAILVLSVVVADFAVLCRLLVVSTLSGGVDQYAMPYRGTILKVPMCLQAKKYWL